MLLSFEEFKSFEPKKDTYALFGYPLGHSMSPELHSSLFETYDLDADYVAIEVAPENLAEAFELAKHKLMGINLTIPHKKNIISMLDDIDCQAKALNSVNTVAIVDGKTCGYNTDILGFAESLKKDDVQLDNTKTLLIGYGGASAVMGLHCALNGSHLFITGRNIEKANDLKLDMQNSYSNIKVSVCDLDRIPNDIDIVVNGTPLGMYPHEDTCPLERLPKNTTYIFDAIYNPPITSTMKLGSKKVKTRDGLYMLVMQAAKAQEIWTGHCFEDGDCDTILRKLYGKMAVKRLKNIKNKENFVLCGFMGSGKTTIGKKLSKVTGLKFIDADVYLEKMEDMKIPEIFAKYGEQHFRDLETKYISELSKMSGAVISLGGGAVLREQNVEMLKQNGLMIHLNTSFSNIVKNLSHDTSRPLLAGDKEKQTRKLYDERKEIYKSVADISVRGSKIVDIIEKIVKAI